MLDLKHAAVPPPVQHDGSDVEAGSGLLSDIAGAARGEGPSAGVEVVVDLAVEPEGFPVFQVERGVRGVNGEPSSVGNNAEHQEQGHNQELHDVSWFVAQLCNVLDLLIEWRD